MTVVVLPVEPAQLRALADALESERGSSPTPPEFVLCTDGGVEFRVSNPRSPTDDRN